MYIISATNCMNLENQIEKSGPMQQSSGSLPLTMNEDQDSNIVSPKQRKRCCPYAFNSKLCTIVDDRVLCGYNLNVGSPKSKGNVVDLHGGCRLRGGRLECGYEQGPFTNSRRPPVWNEAPSQAVSHEETIEEFLPEKEMGEENARNQLKYIAKSTTVKSRGFVTRCIEIRERIVCRKMQ